MFPHDGDEDVELMSGTSMTRKEDDGGLSRSLETTGEGSGGDAGMAMEMDIGMGDEAGQVEDGEGFDPDELDSASETDTTSDSDDLVQVIESLEEAAAGATLDPLRIPEFSPPGSPAIDPDPATVPPPLFPGLDRHEPVRSTTQESPSSHFDATSAAFAALDSADPRDIIHSWPHIIPDALRIIPHAGNKPNPYEALALSDTHTDSHLSALSRSVLVLAHTLSGVYNTSRRAVELVLRSFDLVLKYATRSATRDGAVRHHQRMCAQLLSVKDQYADAPAILAMFAASDPADSPILDFTAGDSETDGGEPDMGIPGTLRTAFKILGVDQRVLVHPVCRNHECQNIFYSISRREDFADLPERCICGAATRHKGVVKMHQYPRRPLAFELERLFRIRGLEGAVEKRPDRKRKRDLADLMATAGKVYRQQDDGSDWNEGVRPISGALSMKVNFSSDYADTNSSRRSAASSMGPISLHCADLAFQLRSTFTCCMILGITPGPRAPSPANYWKFILPLFLELRVAQEHGLWIATPSHPQGRLVQVSLGLIVADRPAAIEITGGPHYKARESPCLQCTVTESEITTLATFPYRDSHAHDLASFRFSASVPIAVLADKQEWAASKRANKSKEYTASRQRAVEIKAKALHGAQGNLSPVALIPGYPKFLRATYDPMHLFCEGVLATCTRQGMQEGKLGSAQTQVPDGAAAEPGVDNFKPELDKKGHRKLVDAIKRGKANLRDLRAGLMPVQSETQVADLADAITEMEANRQRMYGDATLDAGMSEADIKYLQKCIGDIVLPRSTVRLNPAFGTAGGGSPSASQWRSWGTVIGPLVVPHLYATRGPTATSPHHANPHLSQAGMLTLMGIFEIMVLAFRSSISETQISRLEELIPKWLKYVFELHPQLEEVTNFHALTHLATDLRKYGPIYGWWSFLVERINFVIKNFNRSGGCHEQEQVVAYKAMLRCREVVNVRSQQLGADCVAASPTADIAFAGEMHDLLEKSSAEGTNLFEEMAARYAEYDREHLDRVDGYAAGNSEVILGGSSVSHSIDTALQQRIQSCLQGHGVDAIVRGSPRDTKEARACLPRIMGKAKFWQKMTIDARRFDAAQFSNTANFFADSVDAASAAKLIAKPDSSFESRPDDVRFRALDTRRTSGVLCAIFEHELRLPDGCKGASSLFALFRPFVIPAEPNPHDYRSHYRLDVWHWSAGALSDYKVIRLNSPTAASLRPLARFVLPGGHPGRRVMLTIPDHHH